jgi:CRP-like cAMP-binding protein
VEGALIGVGLVLPLIAIVEGRSLFALDRSATVPVTEISLLRSSPTFAALGPPELERLARGLQPTAVPGGTTFIREGEPGDCAYLVADGELDVSVGGKPLATLGRCDLVGEIALIRGGVRTATVAARRDARLYELDSETFLEAVSRNRVAAGALDTLIDGRLDEIAQTSGRIAP